MSLSFEAAMIDPQTVYAGKQFILSVRIADTLEGWKLLKGSGGEALQDNQEQFLFVEE